MKYLSNYTSVVNRLLHPNVPVGTIDLIDSITATGANVNATVTDNYNKITGNLRVDVEETASLGVVVETQSVVVGSDTAIFTTLTTATDYTAFLRCSYFDGISIIDDYELDTDTFTTL